MKAYDLINKVEMDVTTQDLINLMTEANRQIDLILYDKKTDDDGYLTWDAEHWTIVTAKKFMRTYSLGDRQLRDYTSHNIYDLKNDFKPEEAKEIQIN
ncbi:MAG TPA: hypothetical protein PKY98_05760 [Sedimentibacter sp.]|nr:hypothetical protein [Sedimentibacter sp.]HOH69265.1 hypothetical protein [Sedimentibacter sp.]HPX00241.1 hypothetical protein [Sedimentibacter sp.]